MPPLPSQPVVLDSQTRRVVSGVKTSEVEALHEFKHGLLETGALAFSLGGKYYAEQLFKQINQDYERCAR